jgi:hypothetical protein
MLERKSIQSEAISLWCCNANPRHFGLSGKTPLSLSQIPTIVS